MFTADPSTGDLSRIVIEGAFGLGEVVVGGEVEPDTYVVDRDGPRLVSVRVGRKAFEIVRGPDGHDLRVDLPEAEASRRVLADDEILELARTGLRVHEHYGQPQDIEWATSGGAVVHPPVPADHDARPRSRVRRPPSSRTPRCSSPGSRHRRAWSPAPCASSASPKDGARLKDGDVLVAVMTSPDWVPIIKRASALVTDGGGHDLPRRHRGARARRPVRRRHARGDDRAARRPGGHRRRDRRSSARGQRGARGRPQRP